MQLQFEHQDFQAEAARCVCDLFAGQPRNNHGTGNTTGNNSTNNNHGTSSNNTSNSHTTSHNNTTGDNDSNAALAPALTAERLLANLRKVQREQHLTLATHLENPGNYTVMMETGVGKTYTYIKTMYELHARYGWSKFIVVVPSVAIREGVYKSFQVTQDHFAEQYGQRVRFFIYSSQRLTDLATFASAPGINAMIINSQAFNASTPEARRIYLQLDELGGRRPLEIIAATRPILIIDEPQSVEGPQTRTRLQEFAALFTLRYSATPRELFNLIYRLDSAAAYRRHLVKRIAVKGISTSHAGQAQGYLYLQSINLSRGNPTATIQFEQRRPQAIERTTRTVSEGFDLFEHSQQLPAYRDGFMLEHIDGKNNSISLSNGLTLRAGELLGSAEEETLRRLQIRETILSHLERERTLFAQRIKVLSLFFIDQVCHYRQYSPEGQARNGLFARLFEEEYRQITAQMSLAPGPYADYLRGIDASATHTGYFSLDRTHKRMIDSKPDNRRAHTSDDSAAYELIMRNKERLLDLREPVRFIFSHSALREGWDNPNVFQICTLKQSDSEIRKQQEVGRGLRLCVNQEGIRQRDEQSNLLTIIASESYEHFARALQAETTPVDAAQSMSPQPRSVNAPLLDARASNVTLQAAPDKLESAAFRELWKRISFRTTYRVDFPEEALIESASAALNTRLRVASLTLSVESGNLVPPSATQTGTEKGGVCRRRLATLVEESSVPYDLLGRLSEETGLTRRTTAALLRQLKPRTFSQFRHNPEQFIIQAKRLIAATIAQVTAEHITYERCEEHFPISILSQPSAHGRLGVNTIATRRHLYDYLVYALPEERKFAEELEACPQVLMYVKLPHEFYIDTPLGCYTPSWAVVWQNTPATEPLYLIVDEEHRRKQGNSAHSLQHCAARHFASQPLKHEGKPRVGYCLADHVSQLHARLVDAPTMP